MKLITIDQAREFVRSDGDDDATLTIAVNSAEAECARLANRDIFATSEERDAAIAGVPAQMIAAYAAYDAAVLASYASDDDRVQIMLQNNAQVALNSATNFADAAIHSISLDEPNRQNILSAVQLLTGHFYRNRENSITGQGAAAVEVPVNAADIMYKHRWIGPL